MSITRANGVHGLGTKGLFLRYKLGELDLLAMTIEALWRVFRAAQRIAA